MAETKINVIGSLKGTITGVKTPDDKTLAKSRKGYQVGQSKFEQEISLTGVSWEEWNKRCDAAVAILKGGKISKGGAVTDKRLADAEEQIADLTEKLDQAKADLEQANKDLAQAKADLEQNPE